MSDFHGSFSEVLCCGREKAVWAPLLDVGPIVDASKASGVGFFDMIPGCGIVGHLCIASHNDWGTFEAGCAQIRVLIRDWLRWFYLTC